MLKCGRKTIRWITTLGDQLFKMGALAAVSVVLLLCNCTAGKSTDKKPKTHVVEIRSMKFSPSSIFVEKGDTVKWINRDFVQHSVTDQHDSTWSSGPLRKSEEWSAVMEKDLQYFCGIHVVMKGNVTVEK